MTIAAGPATAHAANAHSPFFDFGPIVSDGDLAILHLRRDHLVPIVLSSDKQADAQSEDAVTNTRFGSFPHKTLLGREWGSQILASKVDTGSRGRPSLKRHREQDSEDVDATQPAQKRHEKSQDAPQIQDASSGFVHLLPPTPESWTVGLPHRTQIVYTPDYSYILQRMRVCPGQTLIEAGAGSGSFTHAAARAVYSGTSSTASARKHGKVYSFEYHEPRVDGLKKELQAHGLQEIVTVTHKDVCDAGFAVKADTDNVLTSPKANAIFLDLPAPWTALKHLTRKATSENTPSALDPETATQLCTFSPCIEQVQATVAQMRQLGWTEIETIEVQHRRIDVRRERIGLQDPGVRGVYPSAANVDEAVDKLRSIEEKHQAWINRDPNASEPAAEKIVKKPAAVNASNAGRKTFNEGQLVHRTEADIKSHTSWLTFAILPREWTDEDEARCLEQWGTGPLVSEESSRGLTRAAKKDARRQAHAAGLAKKAKT